MDAQSEMAVAWLRQAAEDIEAGKRTVEYIGVENHYVDRTMMGKAKDYWYAGLKRIEVRFKIEAPEG